MANSFAPWKWTRIGDLLLICAGDGALRDEDFEPCLELHRTNEVTRAITWAIGSVTMSPAQRRKAGDAMGDHPSANITDSAITRGAITAMAWMGKPWRAFPSKELLRAAEHIGAPAGHTIEDVVETLHQLKREVEAESQSKGFAVNAG